MAVLMNCERVAAMLTCPATTTATAAISPIAAAPIGPDPLC